ncbi:conserved hypothetical protein [Rippkaea orientalis PCC 8801]|uniref:Uncharacterized protein n=1 Tax=Rippkaea orientalis (strain PCC 8801 / RF-1) TaxID=41431 RepID=B7K3Y8_RIPO1|nr:hypothetical protein [Rippkaea orientalis]ACK66528.1 conserved hypothetical protein [Rippkaea orientalis PCC 8801]
MVALKLSDQQLAKTLGTILLIGASLTGVIALQKPRLNPTFEMVTPQKYVDEEQVEKLQLNLLKRVPALGFDNLLADWSYLQFIQYFGDSDARDQVGYSLSGDYFESVVERDPRFVDANLKLATSTSVFAGDPQKSVELLDKSVKATPPKLKATVIQPYYLWVYKGIDQLLFLGDIEGAKHSYTMAANWAQTYPNEESQRSVARYRKTVEFLENNPASKVPRIGAWASVLGGAVDQKTQERAIAEIKALGGEIIVTPEGRLRVRVPEHIK